MLKLHNRIIRILLAFPRRFFPKSQTLNLRYEEDNDLYFKLVQNAPVGLFQTTPKGQIISVNPAILKMLKYDSLEDLLKRDLSNGGYVDEDKRAEFKQILEEKGEVINFQSEWYTKDGEIIYVREGAHAVRDNSGIIYRYDGYVENITDLILTQKELVKAKIEAEKSNKLKSAFLTNISHEIRTPMNSILGFSYLLEDSMLIKESQLKYIAVIRKSGERMLNTLNELIQISRIETGCIDIRITEVNISEKMKELYNSFKKETEEKHLRFSYENNIQEKENIIHSDEEKLSVILFNLISNAIQYTNQGSIKFGCDTKNEEIEFYVIDTGIGISSVNQEFVFSCFQRVETGKEFIIEGTGLGLTIAKEYVEMLGGMIRVKSVEGEGSEFHFTLPAKYDKKSFQSNHLSGSSAKIE